MPPVDEIADPPPPPPPPPKVRISKTALHWLLEGLFIVVGVVLGFAVAEYGQSRQDDELAARVLSALAQEVEFNLKALEPMADKHQRWLSSLNTWISDETVRKGNTGRHAFIETLPDFEKMTTADFEPPFPTLRRVAWDTAVSTGALRLIEYDVAAALSEIYAWQDALPFDSIPSSEISFYDPAYTVPSALQLSFALDAIAISERELLALYKAHLPMIRDAADNAD
jgi:hypothetical protein